MPKKLKVRRGCTFPSSLTSPSTKKSDGTKEFATTDLMDGCNVLPETHVETPQGLPSHFE